MVKKFVFSVFVLIIPIILLADESYIHHEISAFVNPTNHSIKFIDKITVPGDQVTDDLHFLVVKDLEVKSETPGVILNLEEAEKNANDTGMDREDLENHNQFSQNKYSVKFTDKFESDFEFSISCEGKIHYTVEDMGEKYARGFSQSPGIISEIGVYLGGSTYWVPYFNDKLITFELTTEIPENWDVVSQGTRTVHEIKDGMKTIHWSAKEPMEEVYLIAAEFNEYNYMAGAVEVMAFLRTPDENLANKYLETTAQYLEMYRQLIGPYPFSKFALIENFWETGYGMASFTLLGSQVIRFPFILHSSYPHELLHNWWGNSAYVDFESGNWCEGITVYMADHLIKEQRGQGDDYRRSTLQKYTDYVTPENDFPLTKFLSRSNSATEAVGYGKSMMMFNMLRYDVGDELFIKGFQKFYRDNKYKFASFNDIRIAFEEVTGKDLKYFFKQWVERTGAAELKLGKTKVKKVKEKYRVKFALNQIQDEGLYNLNVPVFFSFKDKVVEKAVTLTEKKQSYEMFFDEEPFLIQIDPQFNIFRKLHHFEIPPALSKNYGTDEILILLPSQSGEDQLGIYKELSDIWSQDKSKNFQVLMDNEIDNLPADKAIWIFGTENKFASIIKNSVKVYDAEFEEETIHLGKSSYSTADNSFIVTARNPQNPKNVVALLTIHDKKAVQGLSRKLLHYGKYSYLVFHGDEPTNIGKGQWPAVNSPLSSQLSKNRSYTSEITKREPLARLAPVFSADRMVETVEHLASEDMEGRGLGSEGIEKAANFILEKFKAAGLKPGSDDGSYFQTWDEIVDDKGNKAPVKNIIGIIPGTNKEMDGESVIVCAHYDHLGYGWPDVRKGNEGKIHPGADDNASGIAVMLELVQLLGKSLKPERTIIFVAFTAEESGLKGSKYYVENIKLYPAEKVIGVLNLDTVGRLGKNKLLVLNSDSAREWKFMFMGTGYVTGVESEMVTQKLDASDQMSFINIGVPGVQFFSGPNADYHKPSDTADKIDGPGMVKVATFVREAILYLASREEPLSFAGQKPASHPRMVNKGERSVSTGSMPDFAFKGKGVKIGGLAPDSPAQKAGLQKGDVIIKIGDFEVNDLREYSSALKSFKLGDEVDLIYIRDDKENSTKIKLGAK